MAKESKSSSSIGVSGLLLVAFIVLKLCGVIDWSWWWVLSPLWIPIVFVILIGIGMLGFFAWIIKLFR